MEVRCTFSKTKVELVTIMVIKLNLSGLQDGLDRAEFVIVVVTKSQIFSSLGFVFISYKWEK